MPKPTTILIHEYDPSKGVFLDDDGDPMFGFYYQFADDEDTPIGGMIGPYRYGRTAEKAAARAFDTEDF